MKYRLLCLLAVVITSFSTTAQGQDSVHYAKEYAQVDSFINIARPKSARKVVEGIYQQALADNQQAEVMKAQVYLMRTGTENNDDASIENINTAQRVASGTTFPYSNLWHSIAAELLWDYYKSHRWNMLSRSTVANDTAADISTWDAAHFFSVISSHYQQSLTGSGRLRRIFPGDYRPIIIRGLHTETLRPSLYDLLAFRAVSYFENDEKEATKPAYQFTISDARMFAPAGQFVKEKFTSKDTASLQYKAILLYQDIIADHLKDSNPDALIDADLMRLAFVYTYATLSNKKELYRNALQAIANKQYTGNGPAEVAYLISQLAYREDNSSMYPYNYYRGRNRQPEEPQKHTRNVPQIRQQLETIISKWGIQTEGGTNAQNMLNDLLAPALSLQCEEVVIPGEATKVLVGYRNVPTAYFRLVKLRYNDWDGLEHRDDSEQRIVLLHAPIISQWQTALPGTGDMEAHTTEVKVDAVPNGIYAIIVSADAGFSAQNNLVTYAVFQSSTQATVTQYDDNNEKAWALNRKTGQPLAGAKMLITLQRGYNRWRDNGRRPGGDSVKHQDTSIGKDGQLVMPQDEEGYEVVTSRMCYKGDTLYNNGSFNWSRDRNRANDDDTDTHTFFFTDRSIYRPGQTIFFKGIRVQRWHKNQVAHIMAGVPVTVTFSDANNQKLKELKLVTNQYGSVTGSFTAPEGGLLGEMKIEDDDEEGAERITVEEYKRPKFEVVFDTVKDSYRLNATVIVKGKAHAFAGSVIDGATVKYRVVREARWLDWMNYSRYKYPSTREQQIAEGETQTAADGSFAIPFFAEPDSSIAEDAWPAFTYTITTDITDINGETRSGSQRVVVGYISLALNVWTTNTADANKVDSIYVLSQNLNGGFQPATVQLSIAPLIAPGYLPRDRKWPAPDEYLMDSLSFRRQFPMDEYKDESNINTWATGAPVFEQTVTTDSSKWNPGEKWVGLPRNSITQAGWYVLTATAKNDNGKEVARTRRFLIWDRRGKLPVTEPIYMLPDIEKSGIGDTVSATIASGFGDAYLLQTIKGNKAATTTISPISNSTKWTHRIAPGDGLIDLKWAILKENRIYTRSIGFQLPYNDHGLQMKWATHRSNLKPGEKDTWTVTITGNGKEHVAAELMVGMYDVSLDKIKEHRWAFEELFGRQEWINDFKAGYGFGTNNGQGIASKTDPTTATYAKYFDELITPQYLKSYYDLLRRYKERTGKSLIGVTIRKAESLIGRKYSYYGDYIIEGVELPNVALINAINAMSVASMTSARYIVGSASSASVDTTGGILKALPKEIPIRKNLAETAFFIPQLHTDDSGNIRFSFTMPEALTEWKFMALAHTKDMRTDTLTGRIRTQKDLMVFPGLPRFFRQGDDMTISTKISNLSDAAQTGTATLELVDAVTNKPLNTAFRLTNTATNFAAAKGGSTLVSWAIHVPESPYQPVMVRITAQAGNFTDGEENTLPVLSNRSLVTETLPLWMNGDGTKTFTFDKLLYSDTSKTLSNLSLTVEYVNNPAWYAVQALPYLMEYPYECAEQTFNRYYANALADHILDEAPNVKTIFDRWQDKDTAALQSNLNKDEELKTALLEETPWLLDVQDETAQKRRITRLFESHKLSHSQDATLQKLYDMLLTDGSLPWFKGMSGDRYITQYVTTGIGRLKALGVSSTKADALALQTIPYLDHRLRADYEQILKRKGTNPENEHIGAEEIQYLYMRSFFKNRMDSGTQKAAAYYMGQAAKYWPQFNPYLQGMIALALNRGGDVTTAQAILQSLRETAIRKDELGTYWMQPGYWWYETPVEAQSLIIECFAEAGKDTTMVNAARRWLLKQKQTQNWESTKATADACYALLKTGSNWLTNQTTTTIQLGTKTISSNNQKAEVGTGYFKTKIAGKDVAASMGNITVSNQTANQPDNQSTNQPLWGAVYWQYFEDVNKITAAATPLSLTKMLFLNKPSDNGAQLTQLTEANTLHVGDKVTVRIIVRADRDMEYVHLKDNRAACFEPGNALSGYRWQDGLGYYQSTKDASTNFFISRLNKGTYVLEYPLTVTSKGSFSNGVSTIQCMYAPAFSSHSAGLRVEVK